MFYFIKQIVLSLDADRLIRHSSHAKTHIIIAVKKQNGYTMYINVQHPIEAQTANLRTISLIRMMALNTFI